MELLTRLGLAILIILAGIALYIFWTRLQLVRVVRQVRRNSKFAGLEGLRAGTPAILYFTMPNCAPCQTVQGPAIESLQEQYNEQLQVIKVDATEHPELADYWGVLSVPTTFIIDSQGRPRHINQAVTSAEKLMKQLVEFAGLSELREKRSSESLARVRGEIWGE